MGFGASQGGVGCRNKGKTFDCLFCRYEIFVVMAENLFLIVVMITGCNYDVSIEPLPIEGQPKYLPMTVLDYEEENWPEGYSPY